MRCHLIVMARYPEPGRAKTRMIPLLGPAGAANLHRQLVHHTLATARSLIRDGVCSAEVRMTGATAHAMAQQFGDDLVYRLQCEGDLGARLAHAMGEAFDAGHHAVAMIGTDCPLLDAKTVAGAFEQLKDHDVAIGPAEDGGYYLIATGEDRPGLFQDIAWGGPTVFRETITVCRNAGATASILNALPDVDLPADLKTWRQRVNLHDQPPTIITANDPDELPAQLADALFARKPVRIEWAATLSTQQIEQARRIVDAFASDSSRA
jgi:uncharacterized protein